MKRASVVRFALILLAFVAFGCSASLAERGDNQLKRGNYEQAAANYKAALAEDPDDDELRAKYRRASNLAVEANMEEARLAMAEGAWEDAIYSAERAHQWGAGRSDVKSFLAGIEERVSSEVRRRAADGAYASAVELADLGIDHVPSGFTQEIGNARGDAVAGWKRWLLAEADDAAVRGAVATRAIFLTEAARVTGDRALEGRAKRALDEVRSQYHFGMAVSTSRNQGAEVLDKLPASIGAGPVARGRLSTADFAVEVAFDDLNIWDDIVTDVRSKRYVSGEVSRKNPEWVHIERDVRRLEHELEETELVLEAAKRAYESRPVERNELRYEAVKDKVDLLEDRLRDRKRDLFRTDEFIREEVYSVHRWEVRTVTRTAEATVTLRWKDVTGRPVAITEPLRIVEQDRAQKGFRDANVPNDPLTLTPVAELEDLLVGDAASEVVKLLEEQYAGHVNESASQRESEVDATEGSAVAVILWEGADPASLSRLVQLAGVEPQVGEAVGAI